MKIGNSLFLNKNKSEKLKQSMQRINKVGKKLGLDIISTFEC